VQLATRARFEWIRVTDIREKIKDHRTEKRVSFDPGIWCFSDYPLLRGDPASMRLVFFALR
jgi:hypothetical protein